MGQVNLDLQNKETFDDDYSTPIPEGEYAVEIIDSEVKTSSSNNPMAQFSFSVLDAPYTARRLWDRFVLNNDIALRRLKTLATVSGHRNPNFIKDTEELHGLKCKVRVEIEKQEGYAPKNVIKSYKSLNGKNVSTPNPASNPVPATTASAPATTQAPSADATKKAPKYPWEK